MLTSNFLIPNLGGGGGGRSYITNHSLLKNSCDGWVSQGGFSDRLWPKPRPWHMDLWPSLLIDSNFN